MAIVTTATNYNGDVDGFLDVILSDGADFLASNKGAAYQKTGVRSKLELDRLEHSDNPIEDYTDSEPAYSSVIEKKMREVLPEKMTLSGKITPSEWLAEWEQYAPNGNLTNLRANPQLMQRVLELAMNKGATQVARLFWQGDKTLASTNPLRFFNGIMTQLESDSDGDVVFISPVGNIDITNVVTILTEVYKGMTPTQIADPNFKIMCSFKTWQILKLYNNDVKKTTVGVLDVSEKAFFMDKEIVPYLGFPDNKLVASHISLSVDSNFVFATYFSLENEFTGIEVGKIANLGKTYGYRVDFMADAQYRTGSKAIVYLPA